MERFQTDHSKGIVVVLYPGLNFFFLFRSYVCKTAAYSLFRLPDDSGFKLQYLVVSCRSNLDAKRIHVGGLAKMSQKGPFENAL